MNKPKIPITVITGFLGSGKTTLLQKILSRPEHGRLAVIENEYGALGIDHHLLTRVEENIVIVQNGCVCCTVRSDLIDAIVGLEKRRELFDSIVIETTGLADPIAVSQTLLTDPRLKDIVTIDSIIALVDANLFDTNVADQLSEFQTQIAFSDLIVLSKVDLISESKVESVRDQIQAMNAAAKIVSVTAASAATEEIFGLALFDSKPFRLVPQSKRSIVSGNPAHTKVFSEVIEVEGFVDPEKFHVLIEMFAGMYAEQIYRMKGIFKFKGDASRVLVQVVRQIVTIDIVDFEVNSEVENRFVVIAKSPLFVAVAREWLKYTANERDEFMLSRAGLPAAELNPDRQPVT